MTLYFLPNGVMGIFRRPQGRNATLDVKALQTTAPPEMAASRGASLELRSISRAFGGVKAVRDGSFKVEAGSIHALIGPNGAGKTTIVNIISGFYRPASGEILLDGAPPSAGSHGRCRPPRHRRTFQTIKLFGDMTVLEHVMVGFSSRPAPGSGRRCCRARRARRTAISPPRAS